MGHEHEVIMLLNKGQDILSKISNKSEQRNLSKTLENITKQWEKVKKEAIDRHTRLQSALVSIHGMV